MKKYMIKLISLTSILTICFVMPINAEPNTKSVEIHQVFQMEDDVIENIEKTTSVEEIEEESIDKDVIGTGLDNKVQKVIIM